MEWNITEIEDKLISQLVEYEPGQFFASVETKGKEGTTLFVEINGWIDDEDGDVSISGCEIIAFDKDDEDVPTDGIKLDTARIEKEASNEIYQAMKDARDMEETESWLSWGGWFV